MPGEIAQEKLLVVEGEDEKRVAGLLLAGLQVGDVEVVNVQGRRNFLNVFRNLPVRSGFLRVRSLGVVRDAEGSFDGTLRSARQGFREIGWPVPKRAGEFREIGDRRSGVFIMPDNASDGMLETLCLKVFEGTVLEKCSLRYLDCLDVTGHAIDNRDKSLLSSILACCGRGETRVGVACEQGHISLQHEAFNGLREFVLAL